MPSAGRFYAQFDGHPVDDLRRLHNALRPGLVGDRACIFLAGDSSLDNKARLLLNSWVLKNLISRGPEDL